MRTAGLVVDKGKLAASRCKECDGGGGGSGGGGSGGGEWSLSNKAPR